RAGVLLALRVADASDDMGKISEHLAAASIEHGPAFGAVTAGALQYMSAQILQQIYAETPTLKRFLAPAIEDAVRTAEESGD
ncbi:MAG: hypothetical protein Q7T71_17730, partial [Herbiconiux sp.]|nr:hypothetical protein [Herbiconiux sp.]